MLRDGLRKNGYVVEIDHTYLLPNGREDDVEGTLKGGRGIFEPKGHPCVPAPAEVRSKRFLSVSCCATGICQQPELQSNVEKTAASPE